jgi:hypothetical protein
MFAIALKSRRVVLSLLASAAFAIGCASTSDDDAEASDSAVIDDSIAEQTQQQLVALVGAERDRVVEVDVQGETHLCAVLSKKTDLETQLDLGKDDRTLVFLYSGDTFALIDGNTGGSAAISADGEDLSKGIARMIKDLGGSSSGTKPKAFESAVASAGRRMITMALNGLAAVVRKDVTQSLSGSAKGLKNPASETAEQIAEASKNVSKWISARFRTQKVGGVLDVPNTNWDDVVAKLSGLGVKTAYIGEDGAKKYLQAVAKDRTVMLMTHSGKLSDKRLAEIPALRAYFDRGSEFMPKVLALIAKQEQRQLRVIGGGTIEGGQIPVYRAVAQLQKDGVDIVADGVMAGPGAPYILAGKVAPMENAVVQGVDWGGESATATLASKAGVLWGGGGQARDETLRLIAAGKPVWVVRETSALKTVEGMPNAAAEVETAAAELVKRGELSADKLRNLHVFETWEDLVRALEGAS